MNDSFTGGEFTNLLARAALDALPLNLALLDMDGEILMTNKAWHAFATANDVAMQPEMIGINYLEVCDRATDPLADEAATGIRNVITGEQSVFTLEYPCHSSSQKRWFLFRATRFVAEETTYIAVAHIEITERKQTELAAAHLADRLSTEQETLMLLNQIVRHDIRNDANVIAGWAKLLAESLESEAADKLARIEEIANQMTELTQTAADLTQTLTSDTTSQLQPVNLSKTLSLQLEKLQSSTGIHSKRLQIVAPDLPDTAIWVVADDMLTAVFSNVLNNAVFHTDRDPVEITVEVDAEPSTETVSVRITDNGRGIPDAAKETVFGRGEKGLASNGTGLGLYLVNRLMDRYNGEVSITDNTPTGTSVHLRFQQPADTKSVAKS